MKRLRLLVKVIAWAMVVAAVLEEYCKPPEERTGHGRALGIIPYDFRFPTMDRLANALWNPDDPRLFTETPLGVGWALNLYRLRQLIWEDRETTQG
jgi:hypothetical protein